MKRQIIMTDMPSTDRPHIRSPPTYDEGGEQRDEGQSGDGGAPLLEAVHALADFLSHAHLRVDQNEGREQRRQALSATHDTSDNPRQFITRQSSKSSPRVK
jgi:hypothetical protein